MMQAASNGHLEVVKYLLTDGADASIRNEVIIMLFIIFVLLVL